MVLAKILVFSRTLSIALSASIWAATIYLQRKFYIWLYKGALTIGHCMPCGIVGHNHTLGWKVGRGLQEHLIQVYIFIWTLKSHWPENMPTPFTPYQLGILTRVILNLYTNFGSINILGIFKFSYSKTWSSSVSKCYFISFTTSIFLYLSYILLNSSPDILACHTFK